MPAFCAAAVAVASEREPMASMLHSALCCIAGITRCIPMFAVLNTPHATFFIGSPVPGTCADAPFAPARPPRRLSRHFATNPRQFRTVAATRPQRRTAIHYNRHPGAPRHCIHRSPMKHHIRTFTLGLSALALLGAILPPALAEPLERTRAFYRDRWVEYRVQDGLAIAEGDILLGRAADIALREGKGAGKALILDQAGLLWPLGPSGAHEVPYVFEAGPADNVDAAVAQFNAA